MTKRVYNLGDETEELGLDSYFVDYDGDTLAFTAENSNKNTCEVEVDSNMLEITPVDTGTSVVSVYATDKLGAYKSLSFNVEVKTANATSTAATNTTSDVRLSSFPNPAKNTTNIIYSIAQKGNIRLEFYNSTGLLVDVIVDKTQQSGEYRLIHVLDDLPSGVYFYRLSIDNKLQEQSTLIINQ